MDQIYKPFKTALVALDLTEMDDHLIRYTAMIAKLMPLERIFFVHVAKDLELPADLLEKFPDLMAPLDESLKKDISNKVGKHFKNTTLEIDYVIKEGNAIDKILKLARVKQIDLILMGRKPIMKGSGIVSSHIARISPCSLLFVTENFKPTIKKVMVPIDFSKHSLLAVSQAKHLSENAGADLSISHVYNVPMGYSKTGKTFEEFAELMKTHAENDFKLFLHENKLAIDPKCEFLLNDSEKPSDLIYDLGKRIHTDLIVMGSKGRTAGSAFLIGSVAENLALQNSDIPILIIKVKGENMSFLESLMQV